MTLRAANWAGNAADTRRNHRMYTKGILKCGKELSSLDAALGQSARNRLRLAPVKGGSRLYKFRLAKPLYGFTAKERPSLGTGIL